MSKKWVILVVVGLIAMFNLCWLANYLSYSNYQNNLEYDSKYDMKLKRVDGFLCTVEKPSYLSFTGNLSISETVEIVDNEPKEDTCTMIIWPELRGSYEVEVSLVSYREKNGSIVSSGESLMLDEKGNLLEATPENETLYMNNIDKIRKLYEVANEVWGILSFEQ